MPLATFRPLRHARSLLVLAILGCASHAAADRVPPASSSSAATSVAGNAAFQLHRPLAQGKKLQIASLNGEVRATASPDGNVDVRAIASGPDAAKVRVVSREEAGGIVVCMMMPDESEDGCRLGHVEHLHHGRRDIDARIDFVVRVPSAVALTAETMNGAIDARGLTGDVHAATLNGNVTIATSGAADASTLNGDVDATVSSPPRAPLSFATTNGNVRVRLPAGTDADVDAATTAGRIQASFPLDVRGLPFTEQGPKTAKGKLGKGGVRVSAHSVHGDIDLRAGT